MVKTVLVSLLVLGSVSYAEAMPASPVSTGVSMPIVKADVVVRRTVRRPLVRHTVVHHHTTIVR